MFIPWGIYIYIYVHIYIYTHIETLPARSSTLGFQEILGLTTTQVVEDALETTMVGREDSEGVLRYWAQISPGISSETKGEHLGKNMWKYGKKRMFIMFSEKNGSSIGEKYGTSW